MIVRSLIPTAALALALGGPAAALPIVPSADTALPLILAQTEDAQARLRAAEAGVAEAEEALREAEEALAEATRSGGDVEAAQEDADAAREALEAAVVELRVADEGYRAAQEAEAEAEAAEQAPEPEPEPEQAAEPEPEPEPEQTAEPEPEPEPEQLAEPEPAPEPEQLAEPEPEPEAEQLAEPEPELEAEDVTEPEPEPAEEEVAEPEPEPTDRPSLLERMLGREQAQPEEPASEEPAAESAPSAPAETEEAQPEEPAAEAETQEAQPEEPAAGAETQEAQPEPQEAREREGRPSLRERMQERGQAQPEEPEQPAAEAAPYAAPADEPQAATEAEPALDETPEERQERRARRDRRSLEERAEERERMRPEAAEQAERDRRQAPAEEAPGLASELPEGAEVLRREGDRVIFRRGGQEIVRKDESERMRRFSRQTRTERLRNGWTRTVSVRRSGVEVVTVWDEYGDVVERVRRYPDGRELVLIDSRELRRERRDRGPRIQLDVQLPPLVVTIPREQYIVETRQASRQDLYAAMTAPPVEEPTRVFTLQEVREIERVRDMVPRIDLDTITFEFNSADIPTEEIDALDVIGQTLEAVLDDNPEEIYLIEGHTDAVGSELYNLALSDRRAESVAFALSQYFDIPPENLVTQGYGEQFLKVPTEEPERENRRVTIRRITPLVTSER